MSNDLTVLAHHFSKRLNSQKTPFSKRTYVVIPSNDVKEFLMQHLLSTSGCVFGIRFLTPPQSAELFTKLSLEESLFTPSHINLMFFIESRIRHYTKHPKLGTERLLAYTNGEEGRIIQMATELSHVFLHYAQYGCEALTSWEKKADWQQVLWEDVKKAFDIPSLSQSGMNAPNIDIDLHLFHLTHLPRSLQKLYDDLAQHWQLTHYFFSPTPFFWGDLLHEKKAAYVDKKLREQALSYASRKGFTELVTDTNPLLANLSSHGISSFLYLTEFETIEDYKEIEVPTSLGALQESLFTMGKEPLREVVDNTLQVHSTPTVMREIEVLLINLLEASHEHGIQAEDMLVLAPDINTYLPMITYVFGQDNCPFGYRISDIAQSNESPFLQTLEFFFQFITSRFTADDVLFLFRSPVFTEKQGIDSSDMTLLEYFIDHFNIRFAFNQEMKEEILHNKASASGTFEYAYERLLEEIGDMQSTLSLTEADRLSELFALVENLYHDSQVISKASLPLRDWLALMEEIIAKYFVAGEEMKFIFKELSRLSKMATMLSDHFSYESFSRVWFEIFNQSSEAKVLPGKPSVRFASMTDAAITSKDALFLIGIDETSFPRQNTYRSLNQLLFAKEADHQPTISEKDRYLFLQALMLPTKALYLSFVSKSAEDGKERGPSLLIQELMHFMPKLTIEEHPPIPFSRYYFQKPNVNVPFYALAKRYYSEEEEPPTSWQVLKKNDETQIISIAQLQKLAAHPIQFFCNEALGMYFEKIDKKNETKNKELFLSYLERAKLTRAAIDTDIDVLLNEAEKHGHLPTALFKESAKYELREELSYVNDAMQELGLRQEEFYNISFDLACQKQEHLQENFIVSPPITLKVDGREVLIHGNLNNLSPKGLISHGSYSFSEVWKELPTLMLLKEANIEIPTAINFLKTKERKEIALQDTKTMLTTYIHYFQKASEEISPLMPTWVEQTKAKGKEILTKLLKEKRSRFKDPYLEFANLKEEEKWHTVIEELCKNIIV